MRSRQLTCGTSNDLTNPKERNNFLEFNSRSVTQIPNFVRTSEVHYIVHNNNVPAANNCLHSAYPWQLVNTSSACTGGFSLSAPLCCERRCRSLTAMPLQPQRTVLTVAVSAKHTRLWLQQNSEQLSLVQNLKIHKPTWRDDSSCLVFSPEILLSFF